MIYRVLGNKTITIRPLYIVKHEPYVGYTIVLCIIRVRNLHIDLYGVIRLSIDNILSALSLFRKVWTVVDQHFAGYTFVLLYFVNLNFKYSQHLNTCSKFDLCVYENLQKIFFTRTQNCITLYFNKWNI